MLTLDAEARERLRPRERTAARARRDPPARATFSRAIRGDPQLNITVRVCWLMATLARQSGYASMSLERMADELGSTGEVIGRARRKLVQLGLFTRERGWKWRVTGEKADFVQRCLGNRRLDLAGRIAWLLAWLTEREGRAALSYSEAAKHLNAAPPNIVPALQRVLTLGHFAVERTPRGNVFLRTTYDLPPPPNVVEDDPEDNLTQLDLSVYKRRRHAK